MNTDDLFGERPTITSSGRAYARRVVLLEEAQIKLRAAVLAERRALYTQQKALEAQAVALLLEIGPEYLIIDERKA